MKEPPRVIYLQVYGVDRSDLDRGAILEPADEVTWCTDAIFDTDVRYVIDKRQIRKKRKHAAS